MWCDILVYMKKLKRLGCTAVRRWENKTFCLGCAYTSLGSASRLEWINFPILDFWNQLLILSLKLIVFRAWARSGLEIFQPVSF